ncbi:hypothetical protein SAMN04487909_12852 [Aneurinibacillus migulanus]|uniref:Uncharacterized protein n=1 Tax=Aneurinibacillus migulanus TaxID=47500 RepID=A0A1G8WI18_ANEMI|nr:hypothetical protein SAMN04487909_12852 [Aneurinibacillus migulanus]
MASKDLGIGGGRMSAFCILVSVYCCFVSLTGAGQDDFEIFAAAGSLTFVFFLLAIVFLFI